MHPRLKSRRVYNRSSMIDPLLPMRQRTSRFTWTVNLPIERENRTSEILHDLTPSRQRIAVAPAD